MNSHCYDLNDIVTIRVFEEGWGYQNFQLPRKLLEWHSSYFAAALDPQGFGRTIVSELVIKDCIRVFEAFRCWLFTGRLVDPVEPVDNTKRDRKNTSLSNQNICQVWTFGNFRGIPGLKNAAIDLLHEQDTLAWNFHYERIKYVYENTEAGSDLRRYIVDDYVLNVEPKDSVKIIEPQEATVEFLFDAIPDLIISASSGTRITRHGWAIIDRCQWHDHSGPGGKLRSQNRQ